MATASAAFALIDVTLLEAAAAAGTGIQTQIVSEAAQLFVRLPAAGMPRSGTGDFGDPACRWPASRPVLVDFVVMVHRLARMWMVACSFLHNPRHVPEACLVPPHCHIATQTRTCASALFRSSLGPVAGTACALAGCSFTCPRQAWPTGASSGLTLHTVLVSCSTSP